MLCARKHRGGVLQIAPHFFPLLMGARRSLPHLELAGGAEGGSLLDLGLESGVNLVVGMANDGGAPRADVVDVLVAIDVPAVGALDPLKDDGLAAHRLEGTHGRVDATRQQGLRLLEDLRAIAAQAGCG